MERQQGNGNGNDHGNRNGLENSVPEGDRLMTLASFLKVQHVPGGQQVEFAIYMLKGDAQHWWQGVSQLLGQGGFEITWADFCTEFYKKYFSLSARTAKELELLQLRQKSMTVAEYTRIFEDLCQFSKVYQGNLAEYEEWKCIKYEGGLREELLALVGPMEIRNFAELVNKSQLAEECSKKLAVARTNCREAAQHSFNRKLAPRRRDFKSNGQQQHWN
ncbi:hypothetical protein AHAS_Ahas13G0374600 [Arachis hypogaea]